MKKKLIVTILLLLLVVLFFLFLFLFAPKKKKKMECSIDTILIENEANLLYKFTGYGDRVYEQVLFVTLNVTDEELINDYQRIMSENMECGGFELFDDHISYRCDYDLIKGHYYEELENEDGEITFDILKNYYEGEKYTCTYK